VVADPQLAVYLIRHAQDHAAAAVRFADEGLSPEGERQARALARAIAEVDFSFCLTSPLRRALETAKLVVEGRDIPLRQEPLLAEGAIGELDGLSYREGGKRFPDDFRLGSTVMARVASAGRTAPGGESRAAFLSRAEAAARLLLDQLKEGDSNLLVVSHGGLLNYLLQTLIGVPVRDEVPFGFDYCGVVRLLHWQEGTGFGPFPMLRFGPA
jgi:broad specificity phosphatase PhoE